MPSTIDALLETKRGFVVAAAGCGKTEAIARAVERSDGGKQLVLTHTHAGVKALRDRLIRFGVSEERFRVDTIAGWCLRYAASFPHRSGLTDDTPTAKNWGLVYPAALAMLETPAVQQVVASSYTGLFVDEYQDCTQTQHAVIMQLAEHLPCRVLGDPLQGIFGFNDDPLVDWESDVEGSFEALPELVTPHRWRNNKRLGARLLEVRAAILAGEQIDMRQAPFTWRQLPAGANDQIAAQVSACEDLHSASGSVVALRKWARECYTVAGRLSGRYTCMEEMDCKDLLASAESIENATGVARCAAALEFVDRCMTGVATPLSTIRKNVSDGELPAPERLAKHKDIASAVVTASREPSLGHVLQLLRLIDKVPGRRIFRRELWREMVRALQVYSAGRGESLREAAWELRHRLRRQGRAIEQRTISRTLLVKGLEFEHALVLDAAEHDAKNLYVAITRPTNSLTVCSRNPLFRF